MELSRLTAWLDTYLDVGGFDDASLNGLQVEGRPDVTKVAVAVDSSLTTFEAAAERGADLLVVHHGLFWGKPLAIKGMHGRRVKYLLDHGVSLYAAHLPLDAHPEVGNNYGLARILGMSDLEPFGQVGRRTIGVKGRFPNKVTLRELADTLEKELGESVLVHAGGTLELETLGIITGGAAREVNAAADEGLDAFLTGEPKHETFYDAFERNINALYAGHYMTETVGVSLLADKLGAEFGLEADFILLPTGL